MPVPKNKTVIIVAGPTAVGKTSIAIELAQHLGTEIISADSRQCFKELNIGVARPSDNQLKSARHHFIASHSIHDVVTAATFEKFALEKASELFRTHDVIIMTGGTGLYIKSFSEGLDSIPQIPPATRQKILSAYEKNGLAWLQGEVREKDPGFYAVGEVHNPRRLMRALEVIEATGCSILEFRKGKKQTRNFHIVKIGLELPVAELHTNIQSRVDKMIELGLVEEVKKLVLYKRSNALQTVGYVEIFEYLDGKISLDEATELIKQNTRQYAKRQMTWFRKDKDITWFDPRKIRAETIKNIEQGTRNDE